MLRMLQERCFAPDARSYGHLWRNGHLCLDRRREFMLELCGTRQPLRRQSSSHHSGQVTHELSTPPFRMQLMTGS